MKTATFTLSAEQVELYADWTECIAFRFVDRGDGTVELQVSNSLERVTAPEEPDRAAR